MSVTRTTSNTNKCLFSLFRLNFPFLQKRSMETWFSLSSIEWSASLRLVVNSIDEKLSMNFNGVSGDHRIDFFFLLCSIPWEVTRIQYCKYSFLVAEHSEAIYKLLSKCRVWIEKLSQESSILKRGGGCDRNRLCSNTKHLGAKSAKRWVDNILFLSSALYGRHWRSSYFSFHFWTVLPSSIGPWQRLWLLFWSELYFRQYQKILPINKMSNEHNIKNFMVFFYGYLRINSWWLVSIV